MMSATHLIRIGNQSAFSAQYLMAPFQYAVSKGFDAFEWLPDKRPSGDGWEQRDLDAQTRHRIRETALENDIHLSVHAPWRLNPVERAFEERFAETIAFAKDLGAVLINIHLYLDQGIDAYVRAILPFVDPLIEAGITLAVENTPLTGPQDFNLFFNRLHDLAGQIPARVGMCLDIGHANLCEATRNDYLKFIDLLAPDVRIVHLHVHENYGDADTHLTVFTGPSEKDKSGIAGMVARMKERRFSGCVILEQWPDPPELLNQARDRLRALFEAPSAPSLDPIDTYQAPCSSTRQRSGRLASSRYDPLRARPRRAEGVNRHIPFRQKDRTFRGMGTQNGVLEARQTRYAKAAYHDDPVAMITQAHRRYPSWRLRLAWIRDLLEDRGPNMDTDLLAYLAVYLRFMGTGQIPCREDGGHYRPWHHAAIARDIFERLSAAKNEKNALVIRKIIPWLPSFSPAFTRAEPLTRIRDIAHRNDIPKSLKQEIKHSLQNKLHRCAGPEDLTTSAALLKKITNPRARYSKDFVEAYKVFHSQLEEFFNAQSLDQLLQTIARSWVGTPANKGYKGATAAALIETFLRAKRPLKTRHQLLEAYRQLTELRRRFHDTQVGIVKAHRLAVADIALEDFSFVLLGRIINSLQKPRKRPPSRQMLHILQLTVRNLELSEINEQECRAIVSELAAWCELLKEKAPTRPDFMRIEATVERCRRLGERYSERILAEFAHKVKALGQALGVAQKAVEQACEADIRSHVVFQMSRLLDLLSRPLRSATGLAEWNPIVCGTATGILVERALHARTGRNRTPRILLVNHLGEDADVPDEVVGMIAAHAVPHLCHLAIRLRHRGLPLAALEDPNAFRELKTRLGKPVRLEVSPLGVTVSTAFDAKGDPGRIKASASVTKAVPTGPVDLSDDEVLLPLARVTRENAGTKAFCTKQLRELSDRPDSGFSTPQAVVIPFGIMEKSLRQQPETHAAYKRKVRRLAALEGPDLSGALAALHEMVTDLGVPQELFEGLQRIFGANQCLAVRSSANDEDLNGGGPAGLYASVMNVRPTQAANAIRQVWASLWNPAAVAARNRAGFVHEDAYMAVLIQPLVDPTFSFVLHTTNPLNHNQEQLYMELAVGLGQTLATPGMPGNPYRIVFNKRTGRARTLNLASFSHAVVPDVQDGLAHRVLDYSRVVLSFDDAFRDRLAGRLSRIGKDVEDAMGRPQDIEGVVQDERITLVQTRAQDTPGGCSAGPGHTLSASGAC